MASLWPTLTVRAHIPEQMDAPDCCTEKLLLTIRQFASINRLVSRYRMILGRWVLADMLRDRDRSYHLVDMGAGGCDIDEWLLNAARRHGLRLRITACDADPRIVQFARSIRGRVPGLTIRHQDVLREVCAEPVDYAFGNHFLHHLSNEQIVGLLREWAPRVNRGLVFSDLCRSSSAYLGFALFSSFYRGSFAREDGLVSIRRGFRPRELEGLAERAIEDHDATVHHLHPGRVVLVIASGRG